MAGPIHQPPSRTSSLRFTAGTRTCRVGRDSSLSTKVDEEQNILSAGNMGWKRRFCQAPELGSMARDMNMRKFNGAARSSAAWDGLRRDPELWFPEGDCLVHLYGRGQSGRGPAFRIPIDALLKSSCWPLLDRFMLQCSAESPIPEPNFSIDGGFSSEPNPGKYELYIPPPPTAEREQALLYHAATRNFFAWLFRKSLIGSHLGGSLVGLLNSMNEFRSVGEDNVQAIVDYMDEEGYADMRNSPDHALGVLFFAEHFHFRNMWVDAFAHCTGMHDRLPSSPGFEFITRTSRALITRSRLEMDMRLDHAGEILGSFLSDDLSDTYLGLSTSARAHLDNFRSFLQSYYVAKLGYYPPISSETCSTAFPKNIYRQMCQDFQKLYELLADFDLEVIPISHLGGICVRQNVQAFDSRHKYSPLPYSLPLLPAIDEKPASRASLSKRLGWYPKSNKLKPDPRLISFSALTKATNRRDETLLDCSLVRAYRGFEKEFVFSPPKGGKSDKISQRDARKVRWLLVYTILQTLLSVTRVPEEVRDEQYVSYNLCVLTAGCPPWKANSSSVTILRDQNEHSADGFFTSENKFRNAVKGASVSSLEIKPDIDYFAITHRHQQSQSTGMYGGMPGNSRKGTVRRALSSLGNMPELRHPTPKRSFYHEILVHGYGNGTNAVSVTVGNSSPSGEEDVKQPTKHFADSASTTAEDASSRWSNSSLDAAGFESSANSLSTSSPKNSLSVEEFLDSPICDTYLTKWASASDPESLYKDEMQPNPLQIKKVSTEAFRELRKQ